MRTPGISLQFLARMRVMALGACLATMAIFSVQAQENLPEPLQRLVTEATAARELGDGDRELALLEQGLTVAGSDPAAVFQIYQLLIQNQADRGNLGRAVQLAESQLAAARNPVHEHLALIKLLSMHAALYQKGKVQATLARLDQLQPRLRGTKPWPRLGKLWQAGLAWAKANMHMRFGHLAEAEDGWKACLGATDSFLQDNPDHAGGLFYLVDCTAGLIGVQISTGQLAVAGAIADQQRAAIERLTKVSRRPAIASRVAGVFGRLAVEQGRIEDGRRIYLEALKSLTAADGGDASLRVAALRLQLAMTEMLAERWDAALEWHRQREAALQRAKDESGNVGPATVEYAYTLVRLGQAGEAVQMLDRIVASRRKRFDADSLNLWDAVAFRGIALAAVGRRDEALRELRVAVPKVLDIVKGERVSAESGVLRTARLKWLLDGYIALLADHAGDAANGDAAAAMDEAFRMTDLARGSTVQRALAASASRARIGDPALAELARQEQDLQRESAALAESIGNLLARGRVAEQDQVVEEMRATLARLRGAQAQAQAEIERRFPDYAALLNPKPVGIAAVQQLLKPGEALISIYAGNERALVWAIPAAGAPSFAVTPLAAAQIDASVAALRQTLDPNAEALGTLPNFRFDLAHDLYKHLLAPVAAGWQGARELIIVPHGRLGQLPFGVLITRPWQARPARLPYAEMADAPWLIRQYAISQLPAAIALPALRAPGRVERAARAFIGFGDPLFTAAVAKGAPAAGANAVRGLMRRAAVRPTTRAPATTDAPRLGVKPDFMRLPPLPDTAIEIEEVARVLAADRQRDVYLHERASEAVVKKTDLSAYQVVMFATHGLMNGEMPGVYQPALALANPTLTGDGEDGMLTMEEVLGLKLNADWVVLSACNSAAAGGQDGESVSGLGRAFFYAGAKALLATNWAVETESARMLTTELFRRRAADPALPRARALQQSAIALMAQSAGGEYSYAHPMFWAPYSLIGDGH